MSDPGSTLPPGRPGWLSPRPDGYLPPLQPLASVPSVSWAGVKSVCGREVIEVLPGGRSVRCRGLSGGDGYGGLTRRGETEVVLKPLPRDCLIRTGLVPLSSPERARDALPVSELHAHVRERLLRIRELANVGVANLCGVEEDENLGAMLIWQYVPGRDLSSMPADWEDRVGGWLKVARGLAAAVERLHLLGIVHGRLHLRNVIVTDRDELMLTHLSPLVVDDPDRDSADLVRLLRELNARPRESWQAKGETAVLSRVLAESGTSPPLDELREKLTRAGGTRYIAAELPAARPSRSRVWALVLLGAAVGFALLMASLASLSSLPKLSLPGERAVPADRGGGGVGNGGGGGGDGGGDGGGQR